MYISSDCYVTIFKGALNDESSLVKWMVSGPEMARIIMEYRDLSSIDEDLNHHEDTKSFQSTFRQHVKALATIFRNKGPFCTTELTTIGIERKVMSEAAVDNVMKAPEIGMKVKINRALKLIQKALETNR